MPVIYPDGLVRGDRLRSCSDIARLYWPYLFCQSNRLARLEISYEKCIFTLGLQSPISEDEFVEIISEYFKHHLLFLYATEGGAIWGQWWAKEDSFPKYLRSEDRRSPAPDKNALEAWKKARVLKRKSVTPFFEKLSKHFEEFPLGIGNGNGNGNGVKLSSGPVAPREPEPSLASPREGETSDSAATPNCGSEPPEDGPPIAHSCLRTNESGGGVGKVRSEGKNATGGALGGKDAESANFQPIAPLSAVLTAIQAGTGRRPDAHMAATLLRKAAQAGVHPALLTRWIVEFCQAKSNKGDAVRSTKLLIRAFAEDFRAWLTPIRAASIGNREFEAFAVQEQALCSSCGEARTVFADGLLVMCNCQSSGPVKGGLVRAAR